MEQQTLAQKPGKVKPRIRASAVVLAAALLIMIVTSAVSAGIVTSGGTVRTQDITFTTDVGAESHARLYIPEGASADNKLPAVLLCHGYTASLDDMENNAVEYSRRGYVVMALDMYGHGESSLPPAGASQATMGNVPDYAPDLGSYSALQELGKLDYVDTTRIGMLGHSMGTAAIQEGAYTAYAVWQGYYAAAQADAVAQGQDETAAAGTAYMAAMASGVTLPRTLVLTGYNYNVRNAGDLTYNGVNAENGVFPLYAAPVNIATIYGNYDEFSGLLWGVQDASDYTSSFKFAYGTGGAANVPMGTTFLYGDPSAAPLSREEAVQVAQSFGALGNLRAAYGYPHTHSFAYYSEQPIADGIEFMDVTLRDGNTTIAPDQQVWHGRAVCGALGLAATLTAFIALALLLLNVPFFASVKKAEPQSITTLASKGKVIAYVVVYILCLLPAPLLYNWLVGYPYYMKPQAFIFLTKFMPNGFFNMAPMNSLMLLNIVLGCIFLVIYAVVFFAVARRAGFGLENVGVKLPVKQILKSLLLAVLSFGLVYAVVCACAALSGTTFTFFKFSFQPMNAERWIAFLKYLPFWFFFYFVCSIVWNSFTRVNKAPVWLNYVLIALSSVGGLLVFHIIDMGALFGAGVRAFPYIPGTTSETWLSAIGMSFPTALAGIILFGLLVILPVTAVMNRLLFKKTGSVWTGAFLTSFIALAFTICHMVFSM